MTLDEAIAYALQVVPALAWAPLARGGELPEP